MLAKYTIAGLAGSALLASVAFAQSPSATTDSANTDKATTVAITASFAPKSYEAVSTVVMTKGGRAMTVTVTGRWVGACSP